MTSLPLLIIFCCLCYTSLGYMVGMEDTRIHTHTIKYAVEQCDSLEKVKYVSLKSIKCVDGATYKVKNEKSNIN